MTSRICFFSRNVKSYKSANVIRILFQTPIRDQLKILLIDLARRSISHNILIVALCSVTIAR